MRLAEAALRGRTNVQAWRFRVKYKQVRSFFACLHGILAKSGLGYAISFQPFG